VVGDGSFLVEEFIDSITSQLDRVQDSLRIKAVNRPLTYALKDMSLELKVFVELDPQGKVRFRTSGPNEAGASVVQLGFTTITKPMIEENTVSLAASRSPSLEEAGLAPDERLRLERMGVRNVGQLERLQSSAGVQSVARFSDVPVDRLRSALVLNRPKVTGVRPEPPRPGTQPGPQPGKPAPPVVRPAPPVRLPSAPQPPVRPRSPVLPPAAPSPVLKVQPGTRRLTLSGNRLIGDDGPAAVRLNNQPLGVAEADDDRIVIEMPEDHRGGALEVSLPDGTVASFELSVDGDESWGAWAPDEESS
jgi:hypothetical protein